eukprot:2047231-Ditylum_brightwellii.AAC.1
MTSARNSNVAVNTPGETCTIVLNCKMVALADQALNFIFKGMGLREVAFGLYKHSPLQTEQKSYYLVLYFIQTKGKGQTLEEYKVATRQTDRDLMKIKELEK